MLLVGHLYHVTNTYNQNWREKKQTLGCIKCKPFVHKSSYTSEKKAEG